jgi:hypothetical protein
MTTPKDEGLSMQYALDHAEVMVRRYQASRYAALVALRELLLEKPEADRPAFLAWMRSQPLELVGFVFPNELLDVVEKEG